MNKDELELKLNDIHGKDKEQLDFIFSNEKKILVTASAGCGKTKTMISKIAYELIDKSNLNFKKILALTFSVNASTKIKDEIDIMLPELTKSEKSIFSKKLDVSNYHGFAIKLLARHGYILNENFKEIEDFTVFSDNSEEMAKYLTHSDKQTFEKFIKAVNNIDVLTINKQWEDFKNILLEKLVSNKVITFMGYLVLASELLEKESIRNFYVKYYPVIIVDEFQDTNYLSYKLIAKLISEENKILLMGDNIQKIYGFLGAMPDIFSYTKNEYNMTTMNFTTNYRFKDSQKMKNLDKYIRRIFEHYDKNDVCGASAEINVGLYKSEKEEASMIIKDIKSKITKGFNIAILVNTKSAAQYVLQELKLEKILYFNGIFNDTENSYRIFHQISLKKFITESGMGKSISQRIIEKVILDVEQCKAEITDDDVIFDSLMKLLRVLFKSVKKADLSREAKYEKIKFILSNKSLKRLMNEMDEKIVITTIHGSKGLEWDYVYIPQMVKSQFPSYPALCKDCPNLSNSPSNNMCEFPSHKNDLNEKFKEQLSIFYVAITRAKKDVYIFANSGKNRNGYYKNFSCLLSLPNLRCISEFLD